MRKYTEKYGKERPGEHSCQVRRVGLDPGSHKGNVIIMFALEISKT